MIDVDDIRARYRRSVPFLDERGRRLFAANEALAVGYGGVTAVALATGLARSTIQRAIVELQGGSNPIGPRVRRRGGGRKRAVVLQPGLPAALETLIEDAIRGDPETPLRWVSRTGLTVRCELDASSYPKGVKVTDAEMAALAIERDPFHGEWNYTISPNQQPS